MFKAAICEDCPNQRKIIKALLTGFSKAERGAQIRPHLFASGEALLEDKGAEDFDFYLLDIYMPGMNGIETARKLRQRGVGAPIVFLTTSTRHALDAFGVEAAQYILKPVTTDRFFYTLDKVLQTLARQDKTFVLATPDRIVQIPFSSICQIRLESRALNIVLSGGKHLQGKKLRAAFCDEIAPLLGDDRFLLAHKSCLVNMHYVREMTAGSLLLCTGDEVLIPRMRMSRVRSSFLRFLETSKGGGGT